jgi:hypothetical protein
MASASYTTGNIRQKYVCQTEIEITAAPLVEIGRVTVEPDLITVTYARTKDSAWRIVTSAVSGYTTRVREDGYVDRRTVRYERLEDAPRWIAAAVRSNLPARS